MVKQAFRLKEALKTPRSDQNIYKKWYGNDVFNAKNVYGNPVFHKLILRMVRGWDSKPVFFLFMTYLCRFLGFLTDFHVVHKWLDTGLFVDPCESSKGEGPITRRFMHRPEEVYVCKVGP